MAKLQGYICPYCKDRVAKEDSVQEGKRYFHFDCLEKKKEEEKEQRRHAEDYKSLIDYICRLYGLDAPTGMILKQVKDFQTEYNFKLKGMELALRYFHETQNNPVIEGNGIGIIVYVYEEAKRHFMTKMKVEASLKEMEECDKYQEIVVDLSRKIKRKNNFIDISSIL